MCSRSGSRVNPIWTRASGVPGNHRTYSLPTAFRNVCKEGAQDMTERYRIARQSGCVPYCLFKECYRTAEPLPYRYDSEFSRWSRTPSPAHTPNRFVQPRPAMRKHNRRPILYRLGTTFSIRSNMASDVAVVGRAKNSPHALPAAIMRWARIRGASVLSVPVTSSSTAN